MGGPWQWTACLLLCLGLFLHCGEAMVNTEATTGPLYRAVGTSLHISCNVSGFRDEHLNKHFEIRFRNLPNTNQANIISSRDKSFAYTAYYKRVKTKEITLNRVSANLVLFEIQNLQKSDEGEYECSVINPEHSYNGVYSAFTVVKVIDNSLTVSTPVSNSWSYTEGEAFTSTCEASANTVQHTHLSVAWYLHKDGEDTPQPIIALDRFFTISPGLAFEGRYKAGKIKLDKVGEAMYRLEIAQLQQSDQGSIFCRAQEWIQEPDRSWYSITQKDTEEARLFVAARVVTPDATSLAVSISLQSTTLQVGQSLSITCSVKSQNLEDQFFSVAWLKGGVELTNIGPTGVLSVGHAYSMREGELKVARVSDKDFRLRLQPVRVEDQGEYICKAWPEKRGQDGAFTQGMAQTSSPLSVTISATESGLSLQRIQDASIKEGDLLKLTCKVNSYKGLLSVNWQHKSTVTSASIFTNVISLSQEGVTAKAAEFENRKVRATRPTADTFTLELEEVSPQDAGFYQCVVSEWEGNRNTNSQTETANVIVTPAESFVKVSLSSRNSAATVGSNVDLMCRVMGVHKPVTVTWSLQRDATTVDSILTAYSNGAISWSGAQHRYQLKIEKTETALVHHLVINAASHWEAGRYQCSVSYNTHKKPMQSNELAVHVTNPESKLSLTSAPTVTANINEDVEIRCSVISEPSASSRYSVTWQVQRGQDARRKTIVSSDKDAQVTFGQQVEQSYRQRTSVKRTTGPSFELSIRQTWVSDTGTYYCEVGEWLQNPQGDWYELSKASRSTNLTITEPESKLSLTSVPAVTANIDTDVEIRCSVISEPSASSRYSVTWLVQRGQDARRKTIVSSDKDAQVTFGQQVEQSYRQRTSLKRTTGPSFELSIRQTWISDTGTYYCEVGEWLQNPQGDWYQLSKVSRSTNLTITEPEKKLSVFMKEVEMNVSQSQDFTIPCQITKKSSNKSEFQVTWFCQKNHTGSKRSPVFTFHRDATLQGKIGRDAQLRFDHPSPEQFSLTVLRPRPEDSCFYSCEVEEWIPSLTHGWRKVATEKSGFMTVYVNGEGHSGAISEPVCFSGSLMGFLGAIIICTLIVILVLVLKISRGKASEQKKSGQSLWVEQPLNAKPSAED